jgi:hypothetical protein
MSDLIYQIPIGAGIAVLAYRLIRAPYEMHVANEASHRAEVSTLEVALAKHRQPKNLNVEIGGYYYVTDDSVTDPDGAWLICYRVVIANPDDKPVALELWPTLAMKENASWRIGEISQGNPPGWALKGDPYVGDHEAFGSIVNIAGGSARAGYCSVYVPASTVKFAGVADWKELSQKRALWLEVRNKLTHESRFVPVNYLARKIDHQEQNATSPVS